MSTDETDFKFLAENSADVIVRVGTDRVLRYVSPSCLRVYGWVAEEVVGRKMDDFVLAEDAPQMMESL